MSEYQEYRLDPDGVIRPHNSGGLLGLLFVIGLIWWGCSAMNLKHTSSQVSMEGPVVAQWHPSDRTVRLGVGKIENDGDGTSGDLSLKLWSCDKPYDGGTMNGELLATCEFKNRLDPQTRFESSIQNLNVTLPRALDRPETITVALLEKKDGKDTIVSSYNLDKYTFRRDDWLKWWQKISAWGWVAILLAATSLAGGTVWALRARASQK